MTINFTKSIGSTYQVGEYAYTGGGRRITGVEITTDGGKHWEVSRSTRSRSRLITACTGAGYGIPYLPVVDLVGGKDLMGMGNNQVFRFRAKVHLDKIDEKNVFRFAFNPM